MFHFFPPTAFLCFMLDDSGCKGDHYSQSMLLYMYVTDYHVADTDKVLTYSSPTSCKAS